MRNTLHKQTDRQTNTRYENNGDLAVNQYTCSVWFAHKVTIGKLIFRTPVRDKRLPKFLCR